MKKALHISFDLPKNNGHFYPVHNEIGSYISEIIKNIVAMTSSRLLVSMKNKKAGKAHVQTRFKMREPKLVQKFNLRQSIKYGTSVYLMATMLAIPASICSSQYTTDLSLPANESFHLPSFLKIVDQLSAAQAAKDYGTAQPFFHNHVLKASKTYGVDAALIRAIILAESNNDPKAVSHRGAQGLMQLMPKTAKWLGVKDSFNPAHNIDGGVRYMRQLLDLYKGDVKLALAAYNAGLRHVQNYGGVPPFKDTRLYIKTVLKYRRHFEKLLALIRQLDAITG